MLVIVLKVLFEHPKKINEEIDFRFEDEIYVTLVVISYRHSLRS